MAKIEKKLVPGGITYFWETPGGAKDPVPAANNDPGAPRPRGVGSNAVQVAHMKYDDGSVERYRHDPSKSDDPNTQQGWTQVGSATFPGTDESKELARRFKEAQEAADKDEKTAKDAAEEEEKAKKKRETPSVIPGVSSSEPMIPTQRIDPVTGKLVVEGEKNPAYQTPEQRSDQQTPEQKAALEASTGASKATTARAQAETGKIEREEGERKQYGGKTFAEHQAGILAQRQQEWKEITDRTGQDLASGKLKLEEAIAKINAEHNRLSLLVQQDQNKIAQRGQDITARGQSLDFASEMGRIGVAQLPYMSDRGTSRNIDETLRGFSDPNYKPQYGPSEGRLQGQSPMDIVNAALAGISPSASPAPPGGIVAPPGVPGGVDLTQIGGPSTVPGIPTSSVGGGASMPSPISPLAAVTAPPVGGGQRAAMMTQEEMARMIAEGRNAAA